jgi:hypothetical protein
MALAAAGDRQVPGGALRLELGLRAGDADIGQFVIAEFGQVLAGRRGVQGQADDSRSARLTRAGAIRSVEIVCDMMSSKLLMARIIGSPAASGKRIGLIFEMRNIDDRQPVGRRCGYRSLRGSKACCSPSPRKLTAITVTKISSPG